MACGRSVFFPLHRYQIKTKENQDQYPRRVAKRESSTILVPSTLLKVCTDIE